jgi:inhibitor of nuclear factor kappa-B kinase subunit alpha
VTPLHLCEKGVKAGAHVYQDDVLLGVVKPLNMTVFNSQMWVFQQDSAPAHKTKMTQEWLRRNVLAFISAKDWPSGSPDLNPRDYKLWAVLENMLCQKHHNNMDSMKRTLLKAVAKIPLETMCATTAEWPERLKTWIRAEGGHFE